MKIDKDFGIDFAQQCGFVQATCDIDFPVYRLATADGKTFCSTSSAVIGGDAYTLTIDLDRQRLDDLLRICPPIAEKKILTAMAGSGSGGGWSVLFNRPFTISVAGHWGGEQQSVIETFIPLIVTKVSASIFG